MPLLNSGILGRLIPVLIRRNVRNVVHDVAHVNPGPPVTFDYIPVPFKPYKVVHNQLQSKFNFYLGVSIVLFIASTTLAAMEGVFMVDQLLPPHSYRYRHKLHN